MRSTVRLVGWSMDDIVGSDFTMANLHTTLTDTVLFNVGNSKPQACGTVSSKLGFLLHSYLCRFPSSCRSRGDFRTVSVLKPPITQVNSVTIVVNYG